MENLKSITIALIACVISATAQKQQNRPSKAQ
jgi:hypothetical protein